MAQRPDYRRIADLERELGIGDDPTEPGMRPDKTVCLIKNCDGQTAELRTWSGLLIRRRHVH